MSRAVFRGATCGLLCGWLPVAGAAGFIDDGKLKLQLRNVYFNENFRDEQGMSPALPRTPRVSGWNGRKVSCSITNQGLLKARWVWASMPLAWSVSGSIRAVGAAVPACCRSTTMAVPQTNSPAPG